LRSQVKLPFQEDSEHSSTSELQNPELPAEKILSAIDWLEKRHNVKLPLDIRYSDRISRSFCLHSADLPLNISPEEIDESVKKRYSMLRARGLSDSEIRRIDPAKFTIFLQRSQLSRSLDIYATLWEELGHATAWVLGINDAIMNEGFALSYRFRGLLKGVEEGQFPLDEVAFKIEFEVKSASADASVMSKLRTMGLEIGRRNPLSYYDDSLFAVRKYNPKLVFRNRSPDELVAELEKSIQYTLECVEGRKDSNLARSIITLARRVWRARGRGKKNHDQVGVTDA
jgi:hypothetical protein